MRPFMKLTFPAKLKRIRYAITDYKYWWITRQVKQVLYWLRTHTYNRYHILNLKSPANGYKWGWSDRDNLMFLAMFKLLCDFVEKELSHPLFKTTDDHVLEAKKKYGDDENSFEYHIIKDQYEQQQKFRALYHWFKVEHPKLIKDSNWLDDVYDIETQKMKELLELRPGMWT